MVWYIAVCGRATGRVVEEGGNENERSRAHNGNGNGRSHARDGNEKQVGLEESRSAFWGASGY